MKSNNIAIDSNTTIVLSHESASLPTRQPIAAFWTEQSINVEVVLSPIP